MSFKDVLLALTTYPEPTPVSAVRTAVALSAALGARISAIACEAKVSAPGSALGSMLLDIPALVAGELEKSRQSAFDLLAAFKSAADQHGILGETILERCLTSEVPQVLLGYARLRDLTIIPVPEGNWVDQWYAETLIFGSGRPSIVLSQNAVERPSAVLDRVMVAWDFSRPASRAVADALPILERAKHVFVTTVLNEKAIAKGRSGAELAKNLARHGVEIVLDEVDAAGRSVGAVLEACIAERKADLLVMGAYGHSRVREFVLGGATKAMLARPPVPILLSH